MNHGITLFLSSSSSFFLFSFFIFKEIIVLKEENKENHENFWEDKIIIGFEDDAKWCDLTVFVPNFKDFPSLSYHCFQTP